MVADWCFIHLIDFIDRSGERDLELVGYRNGTEGARGNLWEEEGRSCLGKIQGLDD